MNIETKLNCGDKGWVFNGTHVLQRTVGQIRIEYTQSAGIGDGFMEGNIASYSGNSDSDVADNYTPMPPRLVEAYMCVETGIGSGTIYTLGEHIFVTEEECRCACAEAIQRKAADDAARKAWQREQNLKQEASLRAQLAMIERINAEAA